MNLDIPVRVVGGHTELGLLGMTRAYKKRKNESPAQYKKRKHTYDHDTRVHFVAEVNYDHDDVWMRGFQIEISKAFNAKVRRILPTRAGQEKTFSILTFSLVVSGNLYREERFHAAIARKLVKASVRARQ